MTTFSRTITSLSAVLGISAVLSLPAFANHDTTYFSIEGTALNVGSSRQSDVQFEPVGVRLKVGTGLSRAFDLEAQVAASSDDSIEALDQLDASQAGVFLKGYLPLGFRSSLYGVGGYHWTKFTAASVDQELVDRQSGFAFGFGVETRLSKNIDLSADFMSFTVDEAEYDEVSSINVGVKVYF